MALLVKLVTVSSVKGKGYGRHTSNPKTKTKSPRATYLFSGSLISSETGEIGPLCKKNIRTTQKKATSLSSEDSPSKTMEKPVKRAEACQMKN
jgi:hypothetical protein